MLELVPEEGNRLPTGSSDTARLLLSRLADPCLLDCGTGAGKGKKGLAEGADAESGEQGGACGLGVKLQPRCPGLVTGRPHKGSVTGCWED